MSSSEDIIKIGKKLDKMVASGTVDDSTASDLLNTLKKFPMTFELLQKTRIGMKVNNFRKSCGNDGLVSLSKALIKSWKKLLPETSSCSTSKSNSSSLQRSNSSGSFSASKDEDSRDSLANSDSQKSTDAPSTPSSKNPEFGRQNSCSQKADDTNDSIRLKCRELLARALKSSNVPDDSQDPDDLAAGIEDCIHKEFKDTGPKYKARVRSRVANLKDPKNPSLRENVLIGLITVDRIACMTAEEMASDELKQIRAKLTKEAINDRQMAYQGGTKTTLFKCGRCGKRDCSYNQVQTRSADEPMTTFVVCNLCGHRWKFC